MFRRPLPDPDAARATLRIFAARAAAELERQHAEQELADSRARAEAANLAKSQFLATVSHEIRTPMHAIVGISELLAGTSMDAQQRQDFEVIQHAARQLLQLINDLLDFSRIESGRLETESIPFTPLELLRESLALVAPEADRKHLACRLEADPQLPELVSGDGQRIRQVLVNLLANAVKFTLRGSVVLACTVRQRSAESVRLRFEVTDTGIGIATESQATLFEPFVQADASFTRRFGGSGLGLAISHRLVELMGGEIGFHSAPEQGSTFWFEIPLATAASPRETPALPQSAPLPWAPARLLLAEDNAINQMVAIRLLRKLGIEAVVAANGREAVELARAERFDVILMDCQMPEKDGFAATQEIRAGGPSRGAAIIALTANALRGERDRCLASGMNDYISKPVSLDALRLVLGRWLLEQASFQA
ncbi:MAG: response regulator [Bryobacterales bacterium]|nr:response regulator [Bryobacterales bacterium]